MVEWERRNGVGAIDGKTHAACDGVSRRRILEAAGAGLFGLSLPKLLAAEEKTAERRGPKPRAKAVIFLTLFGGPSQLETFDLTPDAPDTIRGPFKPIASRTPGLLISEHLPRLAEVSDKFCVVRSMSHPYNDHSGAAHYIQTGKVWHVPVGGGFNPTPKDWPSMGSVVECLDQQRRSAGSAGAAPTTGAFGSGCTTGAGAGCGRGAGRGLGAGAGRGGGAGVGGGGGAGGGGAGGAGGVTNSLSRTAGTMISGVGGRSAPCNTHRAAPCARAIPATTAVLRRPCAAGESESDGIKNNSYQGVPVLRWQLIYPEI